MSRFDPSQQFEGGLAVVGFSLLHGLAFLALLAAAAAGAIAAIILRRKGFPSASFMRSGSGMVWSCQGAPSSSAPSALILKERRSRH